MNKLLTVLTLLFSIQACSSTSQLSTEVIEKLFTLDATKQELFDRSVDWAAKYYLGSKTVIEVKDKERGRIIGTGLLKITNSFGMRQDVYSYTLQIDVKENKARIRISQISKYAGTGGSVAEISYFEKEIRENINNTINDFSTAIQHNTKDTDW
jgi:hypothetical protein